MVTIYAQQAYLFYTQTEKCFSISSIHYFRS